MQWLGGLLVLMQPLSVCRQLTYVWYVQALMKPSLTLHSKLSQARALGKQSRTA